MNAELFFIYDSHCPWSYAATQLVNEVEKSLPDIKIHFWHGAYFEGDEGVSNKQLASVQQMTNLSFAKSYEIQCEKPKDSTLAANVLAWADQKAPHSTLALLNAMQQAHFLQGKTLTEKNYVEAICTQLKLSPPTKALTTEKLTKDAEHNIHEIFEMQDIIGTKAIPALLLAVNDNLILLNHSLYLLEPKAIVDAISAELK
jgi:protein-disulfide isomerase-like protein with CxxC motif